MPAMSGTNESTTLPPLPEKEVAWLPIFSFQRGKNLKLPFFIAKYRYAVPGVKRDYVEGELREIGISESEGNVFEMQGNVLLTCSKSLATILAEKQHSIWVLPNYTPLTESSFWIELKKSSRMHHRFLDTQVQNGCFSFTGCGFRELKKAREIDTKNVPFFIGNILYCPSIEVAIAITKLTQRIPEIVVHPHANTNVS